MLSLAWRSPARLTAAFTSEAEGFLATLTPDEDFFASAFAAAARSAASCCLTLSGWRERDFLR